MLFGSELKCLCATGTPASAAEFYTDNWASSGVVRFLISVVVSICITNNRDILAALTTRANWNGIPGTSVHQMAKPYSSEAEPSFYLPCINGT